MTASAFRSQVEKLIDALALRMGESGLTLDGTDTCHLGRPDDGGATLIFMEGDGAALLMLATVVGRLDFADREPFLRQALRANFYGRGTNGATLSLGPQDDVLLHRALTVDDALTLMALEQALDLLFDTTSAWTQALQSLQPELPDLS
jgi:hypothetical protein